MPGGSYSTRVSRQRVVQPPNRNRSVVRDSKFRPMVNAFAHQPHRTNADQIAVLARTTIRGPDHRPTPNVVTMPAAMVPAMVRNCVAPPIRVVANAPRPIRFANPPITVSSVVHSKKIAARSTVAVPRFATVVWTMHPVAVRRAISVRGMIRPISVVPTISFAVVLAPARMSVATQTMKMDAAPRPIVHRARRAKTTSA